MLRMQRIYLDILSSFLAEPYVLGGHLTMTCIRLQRSVVTITMPGRSLISLSLSLFLSSCDIGCACREVSKRMI